MISDTAARERDASRASNWPRADRRPAKTRRSGACFSMPTAPSSRRAGTAASARRTPRWMRSASCPPSTVIRMPAASPRSSPSSPATTPAAPVPARSPSSLRASRAVFYATSDPGPLAGGGAERLANGGVTVTGGLLRAEAEEFQHVWLTAARLRRPYITVKWASTLDGRAAAEDGTSQWITGTAARQRVHEQREASDAILVGTGTALADDPSLTARGDAGELMAHQPTAVVIGDRPLPATAQASQPSRADSSSFPATTSARRWRPLRARHPSRLRRGRPDPRERTDRGGPRRRVRDLPRARAARRRPARGARHRRARACPTSGASTSAASNSSATTF